MHHNLASLKKYMPITTRMLILLQRYMFLISWRSWSYMTKKPSTWTCLMTKNVSTETNWERIVCTRKYSLLNHIRMPILVDMNAAFLPNYELHETLPLEIETGWYKQVPLEERICNQCNASIEDEVHFLVDCHFRMILDTTCLK